MRKRIDITGERFGRLIAMKEVEQKGKHRRYLCKCECGNEHVVGMSQLRNGTSKSCGCLQRERMSETTIVDLTGQKFGRLTVLERTENKPKIKSVQWKCRCECGENTIVSNSNLRSGTTKSCGCLRKENILQVAKMANVKSIDITGEKYTRLTAIKYVGRVNRVRMWLCKCKCGNEVYASVGHLRSGNKKSCGRCKVMSKEQALDLMVEIYKERGRVSIKELEVLTSSSVHFIKKAFDSTSFKDIWNEVIETHLKREAVNNLIGLHQDIKKCATQNKIEKDD